MSSDDELEVELRRRYEDQMGGVPKWAIANDRAQEKGSSDEDEPLDSKCSTIDAHKLQYRSVQCQDAYHTRRITSVMFNPCARMLLSTSKDRKLKLWEVGNRILSHLHTEEMPANTSPKDAVFLTPSRDKILIVNENRDSSRESIYFDMNTIQCRTQDLLYESNVYVFGVDSNRCVTKFSDDSGFSGQSTLALSPCSNYMAIGSHTGIVNVYRQHGTTPDAFDFRLVKTFNNLVCQVSFAHFNHTSELFAFGSGVDTDALKIAHCPSMTVYKNIPRQWRGSVKDDKNRLYKCADFSPNSGFFVAGQNSGQLTTLRYFFEEFSRIDMLPLRLAHYGSY